MASPEPTFSFDDHCVVVTSAKNRRAGRLDGDVCAPNGLSRLTVLNPPAGRPWRRSKFSDPRGAFRQIIAVTDRQRVRR